jgi:hypothetical protein
VNGATEALPLLLGVVLVAAAAGFALLPLLGGRSVGEDVLANGVRDVRSARVALYQQVLELELDRDLGKLATSDFRELEADLLQRAAALLREQGDSADDVEDQVEREIAAARSAFAAARTTRAEVP